MIPGVGKLYEDLKKLEALMRKEELSEYDLALLRAYKIRWHEEGPRLVW